MPVLVTRGAHCIILLLVFATVAWTALVRAQDTDAVLYRIDSRPIIALDQVGYLRETGTSLVPKDLLGAGSASDLFKSIDLRDTRFGFSEHAYWLHARLRNPTAAPVDRLVAGNTPWLDKVDFYVRDEQGRLKYTAQGERSNSPNASPVPQAGIHLEPHQSADLFVRVESRDPLAIALAVYTADAFVARQLTLRFWLGLLAGSIIALAAYNLVLVLAMRKRSYLTFALHLLSFGAFVLVMQGAGMEGWLGWFGEQGSNLLYAMLSVAMIGMLAYTSCLLQLGRNWPAAANTLIAMASLRGLLAGAALFVPGAWLAQLSVALLIPEVLAIVICAGLMIGRGSAAGRVLLAGWALLLTALVAFVLVAFGVTPANVLADVGLGVGLLAGACIITFASALRYETLHSRYETATLTASSGIEKGVAERTRTLAQTMAAMNDANQRLRDANDRDGLTGIFNRRYFDTNIENMLAKSRIAHQPFSALIVDIDHFKSVNDRAGHLVGDDCIRLVARLLQETAGRLGPALRYGGEEFVVLLPGHAPAAAIAVAERIRSAVFGETVNSRNHVIRLTVSIGVASVAASQRVTAAALIRAADQALYAAKGDGRNCVIHAESLSRPTPAS